MSILDWLRSFYFKNPKTAAEIMQPLTTMLNELDEARTSHHEARLIVIEQMVELDKACSELAAEEQAAVTAKAKLETLLGIKTEAN